MAEGFRHEQVNPAYTSQLCPKCDFVDSKNRNGDKFTCLHCKYEDVADRVAALNIERRWYDPEIGLYTHYSEVKAILQDRFYRRLEAEKSATVPGKTLETVHEVHPPSCCEHAKTCCNREKETPSRTGRSLRERNTVNTF